MPSVPPSDATPAPEAVERLNPMNDTTDPTPFETKPLVYAALFDPKNLTSLGELGGTEAVLANLATDARRGLSADSLDSSKPEGGQTAATASLADRKRVYGENILPTRRSKSLLALMWIALQDRTLVSFP